MAAPSKSFTLIPDADIAVDKPLTNDLMTELRDNDINLEEWLGKNYVAAVDHNHDGVNSADVIGKAVLKTADETVSGSTTLQDDDVLLFPVLANTMYHWEMVLMMSSNAVANFKFNIALSGTIIGDTFGYTIINDTTGLTTGSIATLDADEAVIVASTGSYVIRMGGVFTTDTAGDFQLTWAQNTAQGTNTIVKEDSYVVYKKVE